MIINTSVFDDPCLPHFRTHHLQIIIIKHMIKTRDQNLYQNTLNTVLLSYPKFCIRCLMQITHHTTHYIYIILETLLTNVGFKLQGILTS